MKAALDHVGIAVSDLQASLAFFKDVLGLHVESSEEITSQRVRATFLDTGQSTFEMLEATAPDSPIAKFVEKRGAGLHHVALRVDDLEAALAHLRLRGIRLIDEKPRPGAEGALVAFIHPSAAHGVLVELKQPAPKVELFTKGGRHTLGDFELISLSDGFIGLDGGAMFGVVPRTLWEKRLPPDDSNRIPLGMRPLIVRQGKTNVLIDAGCGDKMDPKLAQIYKLDRRHHLDHSLADAGLSAEDIDIVVASHLHFDHVGGFTKFGKHGALVPRFPKAKYVAHRAEWEDATHPHERNRASYLQENFVPLMDAGVLTLVDDETEIVAGVRYRRSGGHTPNHQVVMIASGGRSAVFTADMYPTSVHIPDPWVMGYDLYPMDTLAFKRAFAKEAIEREYLLFFEHDPSMAAGYLREAGGKRFVERVI
ncbi:MAG TPA: methylmalonyl-CoA epimerase [Vicinamibacterales bacterium]|nr:methylmalonyl-CoA epimerase [Vicinamibacterales bacterium]